MGRDISPRKRNTIAIKAQGYIDQSTGRLIHKGLRALVNELNDSGMKVSRGSVKTILTKFLRQKLASNLTFEFPNKRNGNCGRKSKLTNDIKDVYKEIINEYAHSWRYIGKFRHILPNVTK